MEKSKRKVSAAFSMAIFLRGRKFSEGGKFPQSFRKCHKVAVKNVITSRSVGELMSDSKMP